MSYTDVGFVVTLYWPAYYTDETMVTNMSKLKWHNDLLNDILYYVCGIELLEYKQPLQSIYSSVSNF